jgi:hypothetical protein
MVAKIWTSSVNYEAKGMIKVICFKSGVVGEL